jgi:hypothetical protein
MCPLVSFQNSDGGESMKAIVRKFAIVKQMDVAKRTFLARLSDTTEDRDGDIVHPDGFLPHMATFMQNPVITASHNWDEFSIGKVTDFEITPEAFDFQGEFAPTERGEEAAVLYGGGFMNAFSAGFLPHQFQPRHGEAGQLKGFEFFEQELLEAAAVTVPSNRNAIQLHYAYEKQGLLALVNMAGIVEQCGKQIQEVAIPAEEFSHEEAKAWLVAHGFGEPTAAQWKGGMYRFQFFGLDEIDGDRSEFDLDTSKGISASVGVRKAVGARETSTAEVQSETEQLKDQLAQKQAQLDASEAGMIPLGEDSLYRTCQRANAGLVFALQDPGILAKAGDEAIMELRKLKNLVGGIEVPQMREEVEAELVAGITKAVALADRVLAKVPN